MAQSQGPCCAASTRAIRTIGYLFRSSVAVFVDWEWDHPVDGIDFVIGADSFSGSTFQPLGYVLVFRDADGEPGRSSESVARALVLEPVEGPTLADRIAQGAMPVDEALPIAQQIANQSTSLATHAGSPFLTRISDIAVVPYRQDQAPRLDFWGSAVRNDTREGDTLWVNYTWSHFSSRSTVS